MRKVLLATFSVLLLVPAMVSAQDNCLDCTLGIYATTDLSENFLNWTPSATDFQKTIFVGINYDETSGLSALTGVELSIQYGDLKANVASVNFQELDNPAVVLGADESAPADTTSHGCTEQSACGKSIAWASCLPGNRAVAQISIIAFTPLPDDLVIRVLRRFPSTNPTVQSPLFTQCDGPLFTKTRVTGGCFVFNPTVGPGGMVDDCEIKVPVAPNSWSKIKSLYR
ncbi:MAG: hypothetical protein JSW67_01440 [Candidatus Latescibacterota bacterium]|nr:MAG: hypothetical protein JSW67_01440 [Candidatus Latescibacterota bacterium]